MRPLLIVAAAWPLLCGSPAFAQVGTLTPSLGITSSLGTVPGAPVGPNGLQTDASPTVTPVPNGVTGTITMPSTSSGAGACSTVASSPLGTFGSPATYDGGGLATGTTTPATAATPAITTSSTVSATSGASTSSGMLDTSGLSGTCGSGSSSFAASSSPTSTSPTAPAAGVRTGIPLASYEIGNLGVSSAPAVPTPNVSPIVGTAGPSFSVRTIPTVTASPTAASTIP
jgi:hypothetical protein